MMGILKNTTHMKSRPALLVDHNLPYPHYIGRITNSREPKNKKSNMEKSHVKCHCNIERNEELQRELSYQKSEDT